MLAASGVTPNVFMLEDSPGIKIRTFPPGAPSAIIDNLKNQLDGLIA